MPVVADASVAIRADMSKFNTDLKKGADTGAQTMGQRMQGLLTPANALKGLAAGWAASEVAQFISGAVNSAAEFQDTVSATGVIFGEELVPQMEEWGEAAAQNFGASKQEAISAANVIATLGKSAGLMGEELLTFSQDMVQIGGDLASMFGGSTQDAITAVAAGLRGEAEPLRRYGVLLDDATLRQRAFEMGLISTTSNALTPQQKVLAAQAEILEQTSDAQGDFARTSDGMANTQRELKAQFENVVIEIGEKFLPLALDLANFVNDVLVPAFDFLSVTLDIALTPLRALSTVLGTIGDVIGTVGQAVGIGADEISEESQKSAESWESMTTSISDATYATADVVVDESERLAQAPRLAIEAELAPIRDAAFQTQVSYAKGLLDGQNAPKVQMEALKQLQEESMSRTAEIAYLKGQLTSSELAAGISSDIDTVRAQAEAARLAIVNRLATLGEDASSWGYGVASSLASGLNRGYGLVVTEAGELAGAVRGQIGIESEPSDPSSPLRGITKWGYNAGMTWAEGLMNSVRMAGDAAHSYGAAFAPALTPSGASPSGVGVGAAGGGPTYILQVEGVPKRVGSREDILDAWEAMRRVND